MSALFTADLHLKVSNSEEDYKNFFSFLNKVEEEFQKLFILGDFFSYWFEHPKFDLGLMNPALKSLKELSKKGIKIYFIPGNRDFAAGSFFKKHSGVSFIGEKKTVKCRAGKTLLCHGDGLAKKDFRYQLWRKIIRSPGASFIFKNLPVSGAIAFADTIKKRGQGKISQQKVARMIEEGVIAEFKKGYEVIIAGHAHFKMHKKYVIKGKEKNLYLLPEYKYPGEFLVLDNKGRFRFKSLN